MLNKRPHAAASAARLDASTEASRV